MDIKKIKFEPKKWLISVMGSGFGGALLAILVGLLFGLVVMLFANPADAFYGFTEMIFGGFTRFSDVLYFATPILMTGLAVGFAFKMGLFNIGASGQYTMGLFFAIYVGFMIDLPPSIHWLVAVLAGILGGALMGAIPGILKAFLNVNEVISSIMLNYIGMYLVDMWVQGNSKMYNPIMTRTRYLPDSVKLQTLGFANSNLNTGLIIALLVAITLYIIMQYTTFGYELKATGYNKNASQYAGINYKRNTVLTMMIAGGLAGLGGALFILAPSAIAGSSMTYEPINVIAANGFNGIAVALLGNSHPIGIIFSSIFVSHLQRGGTLANLVGFKVEIIDVVISVIIYFSAFALLLSQFIVKKLSAKKEEVVEKAPVTTKEAE
jgi:simple sugar transport system permease protein